MRAGARDAILDLEELPHLAVQRGGEVAWVSPVLWQVATDLGQKVKVRPVRAVRRPLAGQLDIITCEIRRKRREVIRWKEKQERGQGRVLYVP